ncbi:glutathione S-transferase family protein [Mesorhizobium sp. ZC-5]|uniref:glutathione S-transferase family protein n=1 Tax=Mesorhizobium sp. ZC-5 TaxID=2986066 RepID=UPI0021E8F9D4|nr:glutathione S-transferase family protein [Mesorhizobium sp. ZC-5]MCV3241575.1 glutathione S-transferase family protein [Mesorhizobium sp. ZC-5]
MLKFYYAPWSRASGVLYLLQELGVDYETVEIDIRQDGGLPEAYRKVQPNKKVPAIEHDGVVITERGAITTYLADAFPDAGLAPAIGDPMRGPYLTMNVYCDSVMDPCIAARAHGLTYQSNDYSFGLFDDMVNYLERCLTERDYAAGNRFTAADTQLASAIGYTMDMMKILPERPVFRAYMDRIAARPAHQRSQQMDSAAAMKVPFFQKQFGAKGE